MRNTKGDALGAINVRLVAKTPNNSIRLPYNGIQALHKDRIKEIDTNYLRGLVNE